MTIAPLLTVILARPPASLPDPAAIFVTSRNGVRALATWPHLRKWVGKPVFATGPATARALTKAGFTDVRTDAHDARSLGRAITAALPKEAGTLIYPAARDRSGSLPEDLAGQGYTVRTVEAYRADPVAKLAADVVAALKAGAIDGVLLYSRRTARHSATLRSRTGFSPTCRGRRIT